MGVKESAFDRVCQNIKDMVEIKKRDKLPVTIGMQMVLMPQDSDQIIPLAKLGKELRPDYAIIKHCTDNEDGGLGVNYDAYEKLYPILEKAESYSDESYKVVVKWSKIKDKGNQGRSYQRCYGAPFMLQMSGSGLVAPCGGFFNEKYKIDFSQLFKTLSSKPSTSILTIILFFILFLEKKSSKEIFCVFFLIFFKKPP